MKRDMADRSAKTKAALDALDPATRVAMEGHRPGAYVRLRFTGVPCELVTNFDPRFPILVSTEQWQGRGGCFSLAGQLGWLAGCTRNVVFLCAPRCLAAWLLSAAPVLHCCCHAAAGGWAAAG